MVEVGDFLFYDEVVVVEVEVVELFFLILFFDFFVIFVEGVV